jgi:hypothetical protein
LTTGAPFVRSDELRHRVTNVSMSAGSRAGRMNFGARVNRNFDELE